MSDWWKTADPQAAEEAKKYENPIPSRQLIMQLLEDRGTPATLSALCRALEIDNDESREALRRRLRAMERDGQLLSTRKGAYGLLSKMDLVKGRVIGHRDGYGFVAPADGSDDLYVSGTEMRQLMDGDIVVVREAGVDRRGRREAALVEVLERKNQQLVGRFYKKGNTQFVTPENKRIDKDIQVESGPIQPNQGQYVIVEITQQPTRRLLPQGIIKEVLGDHMAPGMEVDVATRVHELPHEWPEAVTDNVAGYTTEVEEADKLNRVDLRNLPFVTIDGEDAKDFDDAVFCMPKKGGGWRLYVAIADVSHYVKKDSALDREALNRGNSVYFPGYVIPMLPEILSNGLCSLNPHVDRLAMVCEMTISAQGRLSGYTFYEGIIHSHARLTYTQVGKLLGNSAEKNGSVDSFLNEVSPHLKNLYAMYLALRAARETRGAIDFETTETQIIFGEGRKIERIVPVVRNDAHKVIEECMLCANVATARFLEKHELPALYRIHEGPKSDKLLNLQQFLGELGLALPVSDKVNPASFQKVLAQIEGRPDAHLIQTMLLRSMSQAVYSPNNVGHFGLAYLAYTHFTSPIRRYPDLLVHRAIRAVIHSNLDSANVKRVTQDNPIQIAASYPYEVGDMQVLGEHCSMTERRADEATRDATDWLKCEYMQAHLGQTFTGVVSAVTAFGLFVELDDIYIEGLVHITALPEDYYHYDVVHQVLVGERTGRRFRLGDTLEVQVVKVNLDDKKIDFELTSSPVNSKKGRRSSGKQKKKPSNRKKRGDKQSDVSVKQFDDSANQTKKNKSKQKKKNKNKGKRKSNVSSSSSNVATETSKTPRKRRVKKTK
ncbi:ribonuclease R [Zooshikella sp. WH53]|uniref:Ribonuclease R n=2 Tax=Zooshikella harenae TaxID=2827238 RepID=A0ABS5ZA95_9GAMM|nr:ribonuclease R [Zooshikella harenae]